MSFDVDLLLERGDRRIAARIASEARVVALIGPSGIGKTSVLHAIAGLVRPLYGHVRVGGRTLFDADARMNLPPEVRRIGYVFQDARLFPHRRVRSNLLYGAADASSLVETTERLDIAHLLDRWPRSLSGGEARRVAIARALLSRPDALLLDEPLSSLDPRRRDEAMRAIERVRDEAGVPILLVTHDLREAERLADEVVEMAG